MNIQTIIDKFDKLTPEDIYQYDDGQTFLKENEHLYEDEVYNEPMFDLSKEKIKQFLKDSLISILDGISEELPDYYRTDITGEDERNLIALGKNKYRQEVINIINSHR